jgi:hypothetical protein
MSAADRPRPVAPQRGLLWDLLTFDRLMTGPLAHLIYWAGLGLIALIGFGIVGATVGVTLREGELMGILLSVAFFIGGLIGLAALAMIWRGFCEFYVAIFQISEDLRAIRTMQQQSRASGERPL